MNVGIKHPVRLTASMVDVLGDDVALTATAANGDRVTIVASRERLRDLFMDRPHMLAVRGMFERDEISVEAFERELDRAMSDRPWRT
jgi:hypothetical protein